MTTEGMKKRILRSAGSHDANANRVRLDTGSETKTVQSEKQNCDINFIVKQFGVTGQLPQGRKIPEFGDFDAVMDFRSAMSAVREAEETFNALPAKVRGRFRNDPQEFLEFCADKKNLPEMRELGLAIPEVIEDNTAQVVHTKEVENVRKEESVRRGDDRTVKGGPPEVDRAPR